MAPTKDYTAVREDQRILRSAGGQLYRRTSGAWAGNRHRGVLQNTWGFNKSNLLDRRGHSKGPSPSAQKKLENGGILKLRFVPGKDR